MFCQLKVIENVRVLSQVLLHSMVIAEPVSTKN